MKLISLLTTGLIATVNALPALTERASASGNLIKDPSFEQFNGTRQFDNNFSAFHWTFTGLATITNSEYNSCKKYGPNNYGCSPYGQNYALFFKVGSGQKGSISQRVSGLTASSYTMSYAWRNEFHPSTVNCTYITTYGSQTLDTLTILDTAPSQQDWATQTFTFTPEKTSGTLAINYYCPASPHPHYFELYTDEVVLTASS